MFSGKMFYLSYRAFLPFNSPLAYCNSTLGLEDGRLHDNQITASSSYSETHKPSNARLNNPGEWAASFIPGCWSTATNDLNQWIQVSLEESRWISGVITQGRSALSGDFHIQFVTKYKVEYSDGDINWTYVKNDLSNQDVRISVLLPVN